MSYKRDIILLKNARETNFNQNVYLGAYMVTVVKNNGTTRYNECKAGGTFDICNITLYKE